MTESDKATAVTAGAVAGGGAGGSGLGLLVVWIAGYFHVSLSAEIGVVIGSLAGGAGSAVASYGIVGCFGRVWRGRYYMPTPRRTKT